MTTATAITTTTDQARLALFLLPWREDIGSASSLQAHVAGEIRRAGRAGTAAGTYRDGTYERPYRDLGGWPAVSVGANDSVAFGDAWIRITSSTNMAPCARDRGVTHWYHETSGYVDVLRALTSAWYSAADKVAAADLGREMLRLAGPPLPPGVAAARSGRAKEQSRAAWKAVRCAEAKLSAARAAESAIRFGGAAAREGDALAQAVAARRAADDGLWKARQTWREARDRLAPALREQRLDAIADAIAAPTASKI
jgi:hypothetical protein